MNIKTPPSYLLFDLKIYNCHKTDGKLNFSVSVLNSPAGNANKDSWLEYDEAEKIKIEDVALAVHISDEQKLFLEKFGKKLYDAFMPGEIGQCYRSSLQQASDQGKGLRIRLRLDSIELIEIPWEYALDSSTQNLLGLSSQNAMSRYLDIPVRPKLSAAAPLKLLLIQSTPSDQDLLNVDQERVRVEKAFQRLQDKGLIQIDFISGATLTSFRQKLLSFEYHIIHFMGHGAKDVSTKESFLILQDEEGNSHDVNAEQLKELLKDSLSLRLIVMNACVTSEVARVIGYAGIPAIVSMQYEIFDDSSIVFSEELYTLLVMGWPIDAAVSEARKTIFLHFPKRADWVTPVLYLRAEDGKIFDITLPETESTQKSVTLQLEYESLRIAIYKSAVSTDYSVEFLETPVPLKSINAAAPLESIRVDTDAIIHHAIKGTGNLSPYLMDFNEQKRYGQLLFNTLFANGRDEVVYDCLNKLGQNQGLRLQLQAENESYVRRIPWEFMHGGDGIGYLASTAQFLLSRTVAVKVKRQLFQMKYPLRMLIVFSEPTGVQVGCKQEELELKIILKEYRDNGMITYDIIWNPSPHQFQQLVLKNYYHIIHFGGIDAKYLGQSEEGIVLSENLKPRLMQVDELSTIFRGQNTVRLLVLNTCLTASILSPSLVHAGVPSVIAMQFGFTVEAAVKFPKFFYPTLLEQPQKLPVDIAVAWARSSYFIDQEHFGKNRLDWVNPVLTTSITDGNFFN